MTHKDEAGKVLLYIAIAVAAVIGLLIASAWATRTPLYTLQAADHPDCVTPPPDRDVLIGLAVAWSLWVRRPAADPGGPASPLRAFVASGWAFDRVYAAVLTRPYGAFARANATDGIDAFYRAVASGCRTLAGWIRLTQNGRMRWYAAALGAGTVVAIYLVVYA